MRKIAFLDVDMTLVDNKNSEYNEGLIRFLSEHQFDQVYLVTGRNVNDLWQHVLQLGRMSKNWTCQLLCNVVETLKGNGIQVAGISTPYDHYLATNPGPKKFTIKKAGDSAEQFFLPFEKRVEALGVKAAKLSVLLDLFSTMTGGRQYVEDPFEPSSKQELTLALPTYLAMTGDTEKKGQFEFLLERVLKENDGPLQVVYFDDKSENLATAEKLFKTHKRILDYHLIEVDKVSGYNVPDIPQSPTMSSTSSLGAHSFLKKDPQSRDDDPISDTTPKLL